MPTVMAFKDGKPIAQFGEFFGSLKSLVLLF
jgi:thioredoxin-like negative regulator of GroEL